MEMLDDAVKRELRKLPFQIRIIDDVSSQRYLASILNEQFTWRGSKIDWFTSIGHQTCEINFDNQAYEQIEHFINDSQVAEVVLNNSEIYYMNDSALNFSICINGKDMLPFIKWIVETIPLHHYFFDLTGHWCLAITMEGYVDFGFSAFMFHS